MAQQEQQVVTMKQLLEAGVHFGHQTRRWNPKMKPFIFQERNGIYILDLQQTLKRIIEAHNFVRDIARDGGNVIFVGTKKQACDAIREESERVGMYYINQRWLGGLLTNFRTISARIKRLRELEQMEAEGKFEEMSKKLAKSYRTQLSRLQKYLGGVRNMDSLPAVMFIVDLRKEYIAFLEAKKLGIPVVALVDTNCDPTGVDYPIPGNDDAIRAVRLISKVIADACEAGRKLTGVSEEDFAATTHKRAEAETVLTVFTEKEAVEAPEKAEVKTAEPEKRLDDEVDLKEKEVFNIVEPEKAD